MPAEFCADYFESLVDVIPQGKARHETYHLEKPPISHQIFSRRILVWMSDSSKWVDISDVKIRWKFACAHPLCPRSTVANRRSIGQSSPQAFLWICHHELLVLSKLPIDNFHSFEHHTKTFGKPTTQTSKSLSQPFLQPPISPTMSTASKLTLLGTTVGTLGIVAFVHWAQTAEQSVHLSPPLPHRLSLTTNPILTRQCTPVSFEIWNNNVWRSRNSNNNKKKTVN